MKNIIVLFIILLSGCFSTPYYDVKGSLVKLYEDSNGNSKYLILGAAQIYIKEQSQDVTFTDKIMIGASWDICKNPYFENGI